MNRITGSARALTKRTPYNSSQTTQTATNQQRATQHAASDKQCRIDAQQHAPTQATHKARRARAAPVNSTVRQKQGNPATAPTRHSHGASRHRIRNQRHHARQPHPRRGAFPSRAQCANHGPATGEREPPERAHTGRAHPDDAESRPDVAETRKR